MSKHTPGPWTYHGDDSRPAHPRTVSGESRILGYIQRGANPKEMAEFHANATLIAAAPDLLVACEGLLEYAGADLSAIDDRGESLLEEAIAKARLAVAKAKGE